MLGRCVLSAKPVNLVVELVQRACEKGRGTLLLTEISWFWRTGYNAAVEGCSTWESCENDIADLFELVEQASTHNFFNPG